ncbi:MAG: tetratricopeptide repeat protein [Pseudomonadota bacterium]
MNNFTAFPSYLTATVGKTPNSDALAWHIMAYPERSIVTVLVVDTVSSTGRIASVDPDDAELMVNNVLTHIRTAVEDAGGLLTSFAGDGGVAVFGWPESLEDHADRACLAAWHIQHRLGGEPVLGPANDILQFRVGIHSGLVGLRRLELKQGSQLDLVGGTVHLAARLEKSAQPGEILVSSDTVGLRRTDFDIVERPDLPILGEIGSRVFEMRSAPVHNRAFDELPAQSLPIIGREWQQKTIATAIEENAGENAIFAIVGEPGIGKSRLAAAVIEDAFSKGSVDRLLVYRGDMRKRTTPFAVFRGLILSSLSLSETAPRQRLLDKLQEAGVKEISPELVEALNLTGESQRRMGAKADLSPKETAHSLVETFAQVAPKGRLMLLVEDLHLVDPESHLCLELLKNAAFEQPVFVLATARPEAAYDAQTLADTVLWLDPMSRQDMRELADLLWPDGVPPEQYLEKVLDHSDGIPFVLEQLACSINAGDHESILAIPQTVQSMIHARMNRLPPETKRCAQGLSILGEEVDLEFARRVLGMDGPQLSGALAELEKLAITHPVSGSSVRFRHAIIADACSITVPRARRAEVHRAAVDAIKSTYSDLGSQYERLAFHAEAAGDDADALEFLLLACDRAIRSAAGRSLQLTFDRALECIERIGEPAEQTFVKLTQMVGVPMLQLGEFSKMHRHLPRAMELAMKHADKGQICAIMCQVGMVDWFEGRYSRGIDRATKALEMAKELDSLPHIFSAQHLLSALHHATGDVERAMELQRELCEQRLTGKLETARLGAAGIPASISRAFLGWFLTETGAYDESLEHSQKALEIATKCGSFYSEVIALNAIGRNLVMMGRTDEAIQYLQSAMTLIDRHGYDAPKPHVTGLLAVAMARGGRAEEALSLVENCFRQSLHLRTGRLEIYYLYSGYAEALFHSGAIERSLPAINEAIDIGRSIKNPCLIAQGLAQRATITASVNPDSPLLEQDIDEHRQLCERYGLKVLV